MATVSITDQLKLLAELQGLDSQIYSLKRQLSRRPAEESTLKERHQKVVQALQAIEAKYKALEIRRNQMEIDLGEKESQIKKFQGQLFQVKTNKEYSAMHSQIEGLKADQSVQEEEILKLMEEVDQAKTQMASERAAAALQEKELKEALDRMEDQARQIESSIQQLQSSRAEMVPRVDPTLLARYERILDRKEGLALVPVKGNACGGCHMVLPHQVINEIQMGTHLITCESCARILYIGS